MTWEDLNMKRKHEIFVRWLDAQESPIKAIRKNRAQKNNVRDTKTWMRQNLK